MIIFITFAVTSGQHFLADSESLSALSDIVTADHYLGGVLNLASPIAKF
jgi:hypothetical protein